jgi:hypothetical protein
MCNPLDYCPLVVVVAATIMINLESLNLEIHFAIRPRRMYCPDTSFLTEGGDPFFLIVQIFIIEGILH